MAEMGEDFDDKTEEPSQHRRDELQRDGQVFQSKELNGAVLLFFLMLTLYFSSGWILKNIGFVFADLLSDLGRAASEDWSLQKVQNISFYAFKSFMMIFLPVGVAALILSILSSVAQTGFVFSTKLIEFDLGRLDPMKGAKRIWNLNSLFELLKAIAKFAVVAGVLYVFTKSFIWKSFGFWELEAGQTTYLLGKQIFRILIVVAIAMLVVAVGDYIFQRFRFEKSIRMTKQELKEERKQMEGDPQLRARIRATQRQIATRKMAEAVRKADVVVTNPTHIAIALIYDRENMASPRVVAKGADFMAEKIKRIAREAGVPCVENVPLARALYKAVKVGHFISRDFFNAVAEVLAYVYRLRGGPRA
jgi:flagellar biosynthetic protein FlhB